MADEKRISLQFGHSREAVETYEEAKDTERDVMLQFGHSREAVETGCTEGLTIEVLADASIRPQP